MKLAAAAAMALAALPAVTQAASDVWNVNSDGSWATGTNWFSLSAPGATSGTANTDVATFGAVISAARAITVDANRNIGGINFNANSSAYTLSGGNILLTNGSIIQTSGAGSAHTDVVNTSIQIQGDGGSANFTAGSSTGTRLLSIGGGVTGVSTGLNVTTLTLGGANAGANTVGGVIGDGAGGGKLALVKSGAGQWNVTNIANSFTGGISLGGGSINWNGDSRTLNGNNITFTANTTMQGFLNSASPNNVMSGGITVNSGITGTIGIPSAVWGFSSSGVLAGGNTSVIAASGASASGVVLNFTNSANTFTGQFLNPAGVSQTGGFNVGSLADSAGAGKISMGGGTFTLSGSAPVTLNNRVFELLGTTVGAGLSNNSGSASNTLTVNTNLLITGVGAKTFTLGGSNTGANAFNGLIADSVSPAAVISLTKSGAGTWSLGNSANSYTGVTTITGGGILAVTKLDDGLSSSSIGASSNVAGNLILNGGTLRYTGGAQSTNRVTVYRPVMDFRSCL